MDHQIELGYLVLEVPDPASLDAGSSPTSSASSPASRAGRHHVAQRRARPTACIVTTGRGQRRRRHRLRGAGRRRLRRAPSPGCGRSAPTSSTGRRRAGRRDASAASPARRRRGGSTSRSSSASPTRRRRSRRRSCRAASSPRASGSATPCSPRRRSTSRTRFLIDGLGFGQSDWLEMEIAAGIELEVRFYHCNAPPPHRRARQGAVRPARSAAPPHVRDSTSATTSAPRSTGRGRPSCRIPNGLGRHDNDGMFSFYVPDPGRLPGRGRPRRARSITDDWDENRRYDRISAWGHQPLRRRRERRRRRRRHRRLRAGRQRARDPARPARAQRSRCSSGGPSRTRCRAPCTSTTRSAASSSRAGSATSCGDQRAGRGLRVAQRRRHDAAALRPGGRRAVRLAGVVDVQPARCSSGCSTGVPTSSASTCGAASRSPASSSTTTTSSSRGADGTAVLGPLRRRLRRRQQHGADAARRRRSPTSGSSTTGSSST